MEELIELRKQYTFTNAAEALTDLDKMRKFTVLVKKMDIAGNDVLNILRGVTGSGAHFTDKEIAIIDPTGMLQNASKIFTITGQAVFETYAKNFEKVHSSRMRIYGWDRPPDYKSSRTSAPPTASQAQNLALGGM